MADPAVTLPAWTGRLTTRLGPLARGPLPPAWRQAALVGAVAFLAVGTWLAFRHVELTAADLRIAPLLWLLLAAVPATIALNALETEFCARLLGFRLGLRRALTVAIFASAANMLPLPGAAMVRIAALTAAGGTLRAGAGATLVVMIYWLGIAFVFGGVAMVWRLWWLGGAGLALGLVLIGLGFVWSSRQYAGWTGGLWLFAIKLAMVVIGVLRIQLCLAALGVSAQLGQVLVFAVSGVLGSAVSLVPAGLGVREAVSAALAPLVALPAASVFLATTLDRLVGMAMVLSCAGLLAVLGFAPTAGGRR